MLLYPFKKLEIGGKGGHSKVRPISGYSQKLSQSLNLKSRIGNGIIRENSKGKAIPHIQTPYIVFVTLKLPIESSLKEKKCDNKK